MRAHQVTFPFALRLFRLTIDPTRALLFHLQKPHTLSHTKWMLFSEISSAVKLSPISLLANKHRPVKHFLIIGDNAGKWPWEDSHARGQKFESSSGHQYFQQLTGDPECWVARFSLHLRLDQKRSGFLIKSSIRDHKRGPGELPPRHGVWLLAI
jgi:hypothetical protein